MKQLAAGLALAAAFVTFAKAESALPMLPADSGLVFGVEWRKIIDSPAGSALMEQLNKPELSQIPGMQDWKTALLRDLDSILIAVPAAGMSSTAAQPPVLLVAKGRFNLASLRALLLTKGQPIEKYRAIELLAPPEAASKTAGRGSKIAFLDANTIVAGDRAQVRAAIDSAVLGRTVPPRSSVLAGVVELAAANDIWMVMNIPADATKDVPPTVSPMFSAMKSAEMGVSFQNGMAMRLNIRAKDEASAQSLAQMTQGLIAMAAMNQDPANQASLDTLKKLHIRPEGVLVKMELALDRSEFEKMLKEAKKPRMNTASSPVTPVAPQPTRPKSIRISGLEGGPVEIPLNETKR